MADTVPIIVVDQIDPLIHVVRGETVMLDSDLAVLYGVPTKVLNRQLKRNQDRFPGDFCFQLTEDEIDSLRCQIDTLKGRG